MCKRLLFLLCWLIAGQGIAQGNFLWSRSSEPTFLAAQQAFLFSAQVIDAHTIEARFEAKPGYYLYHEAFRLSADRGVVLGAPQWPRGEIKFDPTFEKNMETHRGVVLVRVPVLQGQGAFTLTAGLQGCAEAGLCYPPEIRTVNLNLADRAMSTEVSDETRTIENALRSNSLLTVMGVFAGLGLLLSLTPCALPMLPILTSLIVGQTRAQHGGEGVHHVYALSKRRGLGLALSYSMGMAVVYTALGIAAGLAGEGLAAVLQTPWVLGIFAGLLVLLALSMFGLYELQLPNAWQTRLSQWAQRQPGGRYSSVFIMGAISALIVGPCMAAPLAGTLLYLSQTRDVLTGGSALFALAMGMSVPLWVLGASAGALLPRAGAWMISIKRFFGVLLLGLALVMLNPVLSDAMTMLAWGALLVVCAVYLRVLDRLPDDAPGWRRFAKAIGVLLLVAGSLQWIGVASGSRNVWQPLDRLASQGPSQSGEGRRLAWQTVTSVEELDTVLAQARGREVMLDVWAEWCVSCIEMERLTFTHPRVVEQLRNKLLLKVDVTRNNDNDKALLRRYSLFGPPALLFFDAQGQESGRVIGFQNAERFLQTLKLVGNSRPFNAAASSALR